LIFIENLKILLRNVALEHKKRSLNKLFKNLPFEKEKD